MLRLRILLVVLSAITVGALLAPAQYQYGQHDPYWRPPVPNAGSNPRGAWYPSSGYTSRQGDAYNPYSLSADPHLKYPCGHIFPAKLDKPSLDGLKSAIDDLDQGRFAAAQQRFERFVQSHPDFADGWFLLGFSFQAQGERDGAMQAYRRSLQATPTILANVALMEMAYARQQWEDASRFASGAIVAGAQSCGYVQLIRGFAEFYQGNLASAEQAARAATAAHEEPQIAVGVQPYVLLSYIAAKRGDVSAAREYLRQAERKSPFKEEQQAIRAKMKLLDEAAKR